ncbi:hypothetical protein [Halocalculus aciditolerans]|nr:hypothetical protein [Halocalculus aciditolerans]
MSQTIDRSAGGSAPVAVERSVERKEEGVTVTYHVAVAATEVAGLRIVQPLAGDAAVRDVGFHPEHGPTAWEQSDDAVVFDVAADGETDVILGVAGDRDRVLPADDDPKVTALDVGVDANAGEFLFGDPFETSGWLGGVRALLGGGSEEPDVDIVERDSGAEDAASAADADTAEADASAPRGGREESTTTIETEDGIAIETAEPAGESEAVAWEDLDDAVERVDAEAESAADEAAEADGETTAGDETDAADDPDDEDIVIEAAEAVDSDPDAEAEPGTDGEPSDAEGATAEGAIGGGDARETVDETGDAAVESAEDADGESVVDESVAERLAAEVESGEVSEETLEVLREYVRAEDAAADVRLRHLQSRMSDFEAYADALEETIEAHGTASPFMDETAARLDDLDDAVESVEARVTEREDAHDDLASRHDDLSEDVAALRSSVDALEREVADVRSSHETRFRRLEDDVDMLATDVREARESLEGDVEELEAELAEMRDFRENLSAAFSTGGSDE